MKLLITHAIAAERVALMLPDTQIEYCQTDVGKVNAALSVLLAVQTHQPDAIINIGTAGSVTHAVGTIVTCGQFMDRDMAACAEFGVAYHLDFRPQLRELTQKLPFLTDLNLDSVCNTGDSFVTQTIANGDVVDMENFATARVAAHFGIPLFALKYITDTIGDNSIGHWQEQLTAAHSALTYYVRTWQSA